MVDLICIPGAGAGVSVFRAWTGKLPAYTAQLVCQLPGRENRMDDPSVESLIEAAEKITTHYLALRSTKRPLVIFGHSMGGVLAFEISRLLANRLRPPNAIVISASTPPGGATGRVPGSQDELRELLIAYDPQNQAIVSNDELFSSLAPALQSDISLLRSHAIKPDAASLDIDAFLLSGKTDPVVPEKSVASWRRHFSGSVTEMPCVGGHQFPFRESVNEVPALLAGLLTKAMKARRDE